MKKVPKLRFKEFSDEWEEIKEDIKILSGNAYPLESYNSEGILLVQGLNIYPGKLIIENPIYIAKNFNNFKHINIKNGDILLGLNRPIINNELKVCLFENDKAYLYQRAGILHFNKNNINSKFIYQYLRSESFKRKLEKELVGSDQPYIKSDLFKIIKIYSGKYFEQEKIANFLSSIDKKISLTEEKLELFREYKKGVMQKIFSQELRFKDNEGNDYPEWEEKRLGDILIVTTSNISQNNLDENVGVYTIYGANGKIKNIDFYEKEKEYIGIVKDGAGVGRTFYCEKKSSVLSTLNYLEIKENNNLKFCYYVLKNIDFTKYIVGSSIPHIYFKDYKNEKISLPILEEQEKIANFLSSIDEKIEKIENELENLKEFKKGLLQQMFV
ncbi:MAG: restriction endonuclease subunit S [Fusobacterium perfoetens]|uniref:restriction endonuclease subunit S n=1 Tax=Fusobacterium perfoetens TaxID=852 RepID=UPI0023F06A97|nr:restriction endonuclease subunit S [Fusobacterium perfoetens]MCI6151972.1 restriction endonuclease subunit S [Fusobacterium perfoetens]MDY3237885.1 restriction endonuclease subunit S [Fusobacterium perfoetens]